MDVFKNFSSVAAIEKRLFYYLCVFSFFLPLSKAVGNIFLAFLILGMIHRLFLKKDDIKIILREYKKVFAAMIFFLLAIFVSALTSADVFLGVRKFLEKYFLHALAIFPALFICDKEKIFKLIKLLLIGIFFNYLSVMAQGFLHFDEVWRFGGLLGSMPEGSLLAMSLPVYTILIMHVKNKKFFIVATVVGFLALLFNGTRGVWLATLFLIPAVILIYAKNKLKSFVVVISILAVVSGIFIATPSLSERFSTISDMQMQSNSERILMWESAINMFKDYPIFGVGYGQYRFAYWDKYISPKAKEPHQVHAHNNVIQMLGECGLVGVTSFLFLWGYLTYFSLKRWFKDRNVSWLLFCSVLWGMMLHGLTEFNIETSVTSKFFWYSLGLCIIYNQIENSTQKLDGGSNNL